MAVNLDFNALAGGPARSRKFPPTDEQGVLIEACLDRQRHRVVKAVAFAGATKTTSLRLVSEAFLTHHPAVPILYLAYNKPVQLEAAATFPSNVKAMTTHGLAFRRFGSRYAGQKPGNRDEKLGDIRVWDVKDAFPNIPTVSVCSMALDTLKSWLVSADDTISAAHVPEEYQKIAGAVAAAVTVARAIWKKACDPDDLTIRMPHDGYFKLYALSRPRLPYGLILFDEAQDANPVTRKLVMDQVQFGTQVLMVGDQHQQIYTFRGAQNALAQVQSDVEVALTKSFRFGTGIANLATLLLRELKNEARIIQGLGQHQRTEFAVQPDRAHAILSRTNAGLFDLAVTHVTAGRRIHYVGGHDYERTDKYKLRMIEDVHYLRIGAHASIKNGVIRSLGSWKNLVQMAEDGGDKELAFLRKIAEEHGDSIPDLVRQVVRAHTEKPDEMTVSLTTAHKSKGLEFDAVELADDFAGFYEADPKTPNVKQLIPADDLGDEVNLLYVAATRAKRALKLNGPLAEVLEEAGYRKGELNDPELLHRDRAGDRQEAETRCMP
jgi:hypothetical protein